MWCFRGVSTGTWDVLCFCRTHPACHTPPPLRGLAGALNPTVGACVWTLGCCLGSLSRAQRLWGDGHSLQLRSSLQG